MKVQIREVDASDTEKMRYLDQTSQVNIHTQETIKNKKYFPDICPIILLVLQSKAYNWLIQWRFQPKVIK